MLPPMPLRTRLLLASLAVLSAGVLLQAAASAFIPPWMASLVALGGGAAVALLASRVAVRTVQSHLRALGTAIDALGDGDFSISVRRSRIPEIDELIEQLVEVEETLRRQRIDLHQRELLLDTVVQSTPLATVLLDVGQRVIYSNAAARKLLAQGRPFEGMAWSELIESQPRGMAEVLRTQASGLHELDDGSEERQVLLVVRRQFRLNAKPHELIVIQQVTKEMSRQEVATWKKVIRVISHELNNSIAPISSMVHSSRRLLERGERQKLDEALDLVAGRVGHLAGFIDRYAAFARLPTPNPRPVEWHDFVSALAETYAFRLSGDLPQRPGVFDRAQLEQALINLLRNAHEAGAADVELSVRDAGKTFVIDLRDRGPGMTEQTLTHALIPFYSTKPEGSGIGLSLVREITEAHGGRLSLRNRKRGGLQVRMVLPHA